MARPRSGGEYAIALRLRSSQPALLSSRYFDRLSTNGAGCCEHMEENDGVSLAAGGRRRALAFDGRSVARGSERSGHRERINRRSWLRGRECRAGGLRCVRERSLRREGHRAVSDETRRESGRTGRAGGLDGRAAVDILALVEGGAWGRADRAARAAGTTASALGDGYLSERRDAGGGRAAFGAELGCGASDGAAHAVRASGLPGGHAFGERGA